MSLLARVFGCIVLASACGDNRVTTPGLVPAQDINADPSIVEVLLVAVETSTTIGDRTVSTIAYRDGSIDSSIGLVPGPMIEARRGDRLIVHFRNELADRSTTIHWHGLRLPIEMDGDPMVSDAVPPGSSFDYDFTLQDAGLFWYHPHVETDEQIELGLQGVLLVHEVDEVAVDADRTFVFDDVDLADDGTIRLEPSREDLTLGRRGDTLLVNGAVPGQVDAVPNAVERWRLVNTSNGRFFDLALGGRTFRVIAWDGGLVAQPYDVDHLVIAPGERYEVLIALDKPMSIETLPIDRGDGIVDRAAELVRIALVGDPLAKRALPVAAGEVEPLVVAPQTTTRRFELREDLDGQAGAVFFINDERWPFNVPIDVKLGDTEIWEIVNDNDHDHPFHIHGHFAQVLDRNGVTEPNLGWKDTIVVSPRSTVRAALRYEATGKWMAHCQIPEHAERGMTADVNVIP